MSGWPWDPLPYSPGLGAWKTAGGIDSPVRQGSVVHPEQGPSSEQGSGIVLGFNSEWRLVQLSDGVQVRMGGC